MAPQRSDNKGKSNVTPPNLSTQHPKQLDNNKIVPRLIHSSVNIVKDRASSNKNGWTNDWNGHPGRTDGTATVGQWIMDGRVVQVIVVQVDRLVTEECDGECVLSEFAVGPKVNSNVPAINYICCSPLTNRTQSTIHFIPSVLSSSSSIRNYLT